MAVIDTTVHQGLPLDAITHAIQTASFAVLHAAIYSNFADNAVGKILLQQLQSEKLKSLYLIQLYPKLQWQDEFAAILRPQHTTANIEPLFTQSHTWCHQLQILYPDKVYYQLTSTLPLQPILLLGNRIFVGQYAHSHTPSSEGIWLEITLADEPQIAERFISPNQPSKLNSACLRFIDECSFAFQHGIISVGET